jgi:copper resistance protein C
MRNTRKLFHTILLGALFLIFVAPAATAHGEFVSANPAPSQIVTTFPTSVELVFSEKLQELESSKVNVIMVLSADGEEIDSKNTMVSINQVMVGLEPQTDPGTYTVLWRNVSEDGHATEGKYQFIFKKPSANTSAAPAVGAGSPTNNRSLTYVLLGVFALIAVGISFYFKRRKIIT